jgi:hypothetical protein
VIKPTCFRDIRYFNGTEYWLEHVDELNCVKFSTTSEWPTRVLDRARMLVHETAVQFSTNLEQRLRWRVLLPLDDGSFVDYESLDAADPGVRFHQHFGLDTVRQVLGRVDLRQWFPAAVHHNVYDLFLSYHGRVDSRAVDANGAIMKLQSLDSRVARAIFDNRRNNTDDDLLPDFLDTARFSTPGHYHDRTALTGCLEALVSSKVAVPIVSVDAVRSLANVDPDHVDLVLLEWWAMLELLELRALGHTAHGAIIKLEAICPVVVPWCYDDIESGSGESVKAFAAQLSRAVHAPTYAALRLFWREHLQLEYDLSERSPFSVAKGILRHSSFGDGSEDMPATSVPSFFAATAATWLTDIPLAHVNKAGFTRKFAQQISPELGAGVVVAVPPEATSVFHIFFGSFEGGDPPKVVRQKAMTVGVLPAGFFPRLLGVATAYMQETVADLNLTNGCYHM